LKVKYNSKTGVLMAKRRSRGEGSIYHWEEKNLWVGKLTLPDGKRKTKYAKTQKEINEFYDDSCIVITSIQEHRLKPELKNLDNLFLVFPENLNWIEIDKNQDLDLKSCLRLKS